MSAPSESDVIYKKLKSFCEINKQFAIAFKITEKTSISRCQKNDLHLQYLATNIVNIPQYFNDVIRFFPNILPKIVNIALNFPGGNFNYSQHTQNCVLLGKIIEKRPEFEGYACKYFEQNPSPFIEEKGHSPRKKSKMSSPILISDLELVESCFSLLKSNPRFYRTKWNWSIFVDRYLNHKDPEVQWIACHCLAQVTEMSEKRLRNLLITKLSEDDHIYFSCMYNKNQTLSKPIKKKIELDKNPCVSITEKKSKGLETINEVVEVSGVYLPKLSNTPSPAESKNDLVIVESTKNNLKKIALGLCSNSQAICLQGPVGSGKTTLIEYLAHKTGRVLGDTFVKVQLGDQTDSKMLLGTYRCTDIPGEFVWQPGVVTQAVLEGNWLLLEDIDSTSMDIASVLSSLLENGTLAVPGFRDSLVIKPGFQLFFTQRFVSTLSGHHKKHSNAMTLLEKHLLQINIDPLSNEELKDILTTLYPQFARLSDRMLKVFRLFSRDCGETITISIPKTSRLISTRDFFKWCARASIDFDVSSQSSALKVLQDAIDVFCCSYSNRNEALTLAKDISSILGIINEKAEYFFDKYKPDMQLTSDYLVVGRAEIKRTDNLLSNQSSFYFTRPSAVLLERIMCCVSLNEPVLLVGETGTGKTSSIQYLASAIGQKLVVINMNQQSDSADLLGGYKPVDLKFVVGPVRQEFEHVFCDYFQIAPNKKFLQHISVCFDENRWADLTTLMTESHKAAIKRIGKGPKSDKNRKLLKRWRIVGEKLHKLSAQIRQANTLAFAFIEGSLVKAVEEGHWVLLDEINLANAETLECLSGLLEGPKGSLCLLERGDKQPTKRHENFTLFACMNPSTDVGKKDLPPGLRNRFTEFYVDELIEKSDLLLLTASYLNAQSLKQADLDKIVDFYLKVRKEALKSLSDGLGHCPHFSLRSLCRALVVAGKNPCGTFKRSLYEAFCLSFLTQLDAPSYSKVESMIAKNLIGDEKALKSVMKQPIPLPKTNKTNQDKNHLQFEGYWVRKGGLDCLIPDDYILTDSVRKNLRDLVRIVSIGGLPVLLQGDTSVGKTSLITYLAKSSGNKCVRINNHEHTDLQEYIGSYVADLDGKLVFREGVLVEAMRKGHWVILDELNLAPTDVLEALNRVLDDNRELFIPETQETVKADANFMLFATQNPPGSYGGRKMLSRAFRNRFVELHFNEIPPSELAFILHRRCQMAPSYAKKMIDVMTDLQMRRRGSAAFAGKQGFITLRDLFRWGERYRLAQNSEKLYDWDQHLADEGYLVLAGRVRKSEERQEIIQVLQKHLKRSVDPQNLFTLSDKTSTVTKEILTKIRQNQDKDPNIVWTFNMRQLAVLVSKALEFREPALLVGETGGGKTTVCQLIANQNGQKLLTVNCHMHTESSDFIGGLRPVRDHSESNKLFEWVDGPLIRAMTSGDVFLADEISLADDSVLERLNSLLEPERTLLLAEKGSDLSNPSNSELVRAHDNFRFVGTMNPGGDFGKKELSPALRNRFTEIWCEACDDRDDLIAIVERNVLNGISFGNQQDGTSGIGASILDFVEWFKSTEIGARFTISIRDILTWVQFINKTVCVGGIDVFKAYLHGACLTFLDGLGSGITATENQMGLRKLKSDSVEYLIKQIRLYSNTFTDDLPLTKLEVKTNEDFFGIEPFQVEIGNYSSGKVDFSFNAPTTLYNTLRLLRGMQLHKAILLEGSPGVGKTSLVTALAKITKHKIFRVNLSDQTDISDLFGADLPVEGGTGGQFSWRDGPLLQALKKGDWILLDELNLASQSVLEGLNACLDHRGEIFIPELAKTFQVKPKTRFFACQNPLKQGGSRRGLPRSFLNRFVQVHVDSLNFDDLEKILTHQFPELPNLIINKMLRFNFKVSGELDKHNFGHKGSPWELNLRDVTRWCEATIYHQKINNKINYHPENLVQLIYSDRMRTLRDKLKIRELFSEIFSTEVCGDGAILYVADSNVWLGDVSLNRDEITDSNLISNDSVNGSLVLRAQLAPLRSLAYCVNLNWMTILVGGAASGKSALVRTLADLAGKSLRTLPVTSAMDTTDILGGFEQTDYARHLEEVVKETERVVFETVQLHVGKGRDRAATGLLRIWEDYVMNATRGADARRQTMDEETKFFLKRLQSLEKVWHVPDLADNVQVKRLKDQVETMKGAVQNEGALNAGGKFEWVDSVLIKCLQKGEWLLVDNVNLCSAAVLDRLNALLEPNGVLIISERGVDPGGRMVEIRPHPQFRLFLTMDPKNGEISRAMRNRGIEIYLLNDKEMDLRDDYDFKSLISSAGLRDEFHINSLLDLHDFISDLVLGDRPNINELLRAANTISQLIGNGENPKSAFVAGSLEVYYKTRSKIEFSCDNFLDTISDYLDKRFEAREDCWFDNRVTLKTRSLKIFPQLEKVAQQFSIIRRYFDKGGDFLRFLLVHFYSISSLDDLKVRRVYSGDLLNSSRLFEGISTVLFEFLKGLKLEPADLPVDLRWIPETPSANNNNKTRSSTNATILTLHLLAIFRQEKFMLSENGKKKKELSLFDYLELRKAKKIDDQFDDFLLNEFLNLIEEYDNYLLDSLKSNKIDDRDFIQILDFITWRLILMRCTLVNVAKINLNKRNDIKTKLKIHYRWFLKFSYKKVISIMNAKPAKTLEEIVNSIEKNLQDQFSTLHKISKMYHKTDFRPLPKTSRDQIDFGSILFKIDRDLDVCRRNCDLKKIISVLYRNDRKDLLLNPSLDSVDSLEGIREEGEIIEPNEIEMASLPFCDYFAQIVVRKLISNNEIHENSQFLKRTVTIPLDLVRNLLNYNQDPVRRHEISRNLFKYYANSACITPRRYTNCDTALENNLTITNPILTFNSLSLLLNESAARLGNFREKGKQQKLLHLTLWRNLGQLNDENFDFLKNELDFLRKSFSDFMSQFSAVLELDPNTNFGLFVNKLKSLEIDSIFVARFESCLSIYKKLDHSSQIDETVRSISLLHIELSYLKALMNSKLPLIDPSAKKYLKKEYCLENLQTFEKLAQSFVVLNEVYSGNRKTLHSLHKPTLEKIENLKEKRDKLGSYVAFRPDEITYEKILNLINYGFSTVLSPTFINEMIENLTVSTRELLNVNRKDSDEKFESFLRKFDSSILSYDNLLEEWAKYSHCYPDIMDPLLSNVSEFLYGLKLSSGLLKKLLWRGKRQRCGWDVQQKLIDLVKSPSFEQQVEFYTHKRFGDFVEETLRNEADPDIHKQEGLKLFKCGFQETFNNCLIHAEISSDSLHREIFSNFDELLKKFVEAWTDQEREREIRENEADSLYRTKTKCDDKPEDEQIADELKELFPNYHDIDFNDLQQNKSLEDGNGSEMAITENFSGHISPNDLKFVLDLHLNLVRSFTKSEWLNPTKNKNVTADFVNPLVDKMKLFKQICDKIAHCLDYTLDKNLLGSVNILLVFVRNHGDFTDFSSSTKNIRKNYDFYKDPNVEEVKSCFHILEELKRRISQLLDDWPDQPTLKTIQTIIDRVYSFDLASPLSRFLTGLEILLAKCTEWEEVAHSGVTLAEHSQELTRQIIVWRKIELGIWKDLLNSTFDKVNEPVYKWWLHLYNIMNHVIEQNQFTEQELIETLQNFIAKSSLGEFQKRLELLYAFHCHTLYLEKNENIEAFRNILWNLYTYFRQFETNIVNRIKDLRAPIEKKLRDYVKIVRWKDINYWSIKETVDKSHKTLHRYVREFREVLKQPASACLVNTSTSNKIENAKTFNYVINPASFIVAEDFSSSRKVASLLYEETSILNKVDSYFTKSRKLCKDAISGTKYSNLIKTLDNFVGDVIENSSHLQNLEVDGTLTKEKQKSHAKTILQQKHRALADLFKLLSKMGLSFRTGLVESKTKTESEVYLLKPVDVSASFSHINYNKRISGLWDSCEIYYLRSLMRSHVLDTALKVPAPDLGIPNIERCKGFTSHLTSLSQRQKRALIESSRNFYYLRHFTTQITAICDSQHFIPLEIVEDLQKVLANLLKVTYELEIILHTCPEDELTNTEDLEAMIILKPEPDNFPKHKHDPLWNRASKLLSEIVNISMKITNYFQTSKNAIPSTDFDLIKPNFVPISDLNTIDALLTELIHNIDAFMTIFDEIAFCDSLQELRVKLAQLKNNFCREKISLQLQNIDNLRNSVENLTENILVVIQNIFKRYNNTVNEISSEDEEIEEGLLKKSIIENLFEDSKVLDMDQILVKIRKVSTIFFKIPPNQVEESKPIVSKTLPILEQLLKLYEYFLTQQMSAYRVTCKLNSILLNIFIELASKGFCVPPELDEDSQEGASKPSDGLGLGEGQGEKDVSDKIESEDQLDDAQPAGEEKDKKEDPDCREESGGIEMSEDFDSKLQDVDQNEDEDDDKDDEDDADADEQMGETGKESDKLDQEIWGSDEEEEDDNRDDDENDRGDKESDQQLGAKDDKDNPKQNEDKEDPSSSKEKEEKQKEINEMKEPEFDEEQTDPYHGNQPELPEPEAMDLPDDLQLDEGQDNEDGDENEENPFDVDAMKEDNPFEKKDEDEKNQDENKDEAEDFDSEDEDITQNDNEKSTEENKLQDENQDESKKDDLNEETPEEIDENEQLGEEESGLDQTQTNADDIEAMDVDNMEATDKTESTQNNQNQKSNKPIDEICQEDKPDKEGVGQSQMEESSSGHSAQTTKPQEAQSSKRQKDDDFKQPQKPGDSNTERSLGDVDEPVKKKLKTVDNQKDDDEGGNGDDDAEEEAEMYQHIKDAKEKSTQILDVATKEQAEAQLKITEEEEEDDKEETVESSENLPEDPVEDEDVEMLDQSDQNPEKLDSQKKKTKNDKKQHPDGDILEDLNDVDVEGEVVDTFGVTRGGDSTHHTIFTGLSDSTAQRLTFDEITSLRVEVEKQLSAWSQMPSDVEAEAAWQKIASVTSSLAQDLSEQLRLVLEPTQASRLRGDFRTGRRINMRKVIPYIASQFRKDKIWLRRTKPSKRDYQIALAIDDSSSMADNRSKELAFESVALISKSLTMLESGQLSVLSFGENTEILHKLSDQFTDRSGVKLLQKFRFDQNKTCIGKLVDFAVEMFDQNPARSTSAIAKLLIIVSDGRGVFSEGESFVREAVRRAKLSEVFMVFVIVDNPENKHSVLDIRMPTFKDGKLLGIESYMDVFPFGFYIILRDINSLPSVLSDALRQWFEIVTNLDKQ